MARLLHPLDIAPEHWGRDPQGIYSGGYNFYMTPREMARFGQLYLQQGMWEGRQLVPAAWIAQSWQAAWDTGGGWDYGLLWWLTERRGHAVAVAWGWRGQLVYAIPDLDIVAVVTTDTSRDFPEVDAIDFIADTVIPSVR
jgi:CubicO group peptidase (beta-lactamase class C family)